MINAKVAKTSTQLSTEERLFKLLESIDWKLWEMYNMMKKELDAKNPTPAKKTSKKTTDKVEE